MNIKIPMQTSPEYLWKQHYQFIWHSIKNGSINWLGKEPALYEMWKPPEHFCKCKSEAFIKIKSLEPPQNTRCIHTFRPSFLSEPNRFSLTAFLLLQKKKTATKTKKTTNFKRSTSTSYVVPKKKKTRCVPKSPSIIILIIQCWWPQTYVYNNIEVFRQWAFHHFDSILWVNALTDLQQFHWYSV
jgi:hypothetical protein